VLERLREGRPDAIVLDLGLPDDDGGSVLDDIRSRQLGADVPVVIVSGRDPDAAADDGYASRVEAVLLKPVDPADVVETVRGVLRRAG
jgi:DNA-binding response OmpR family regulator